MEKIKFTQDLIAFKKNAVVLNTIEKSVFDKSREELVEFFRAKPYVCALQNELMALGYKLDEVALSSMTDEEAKRIASSILPYAEEFLGANKNWTPLYGGFPAQVRDMSEFELFVDQIIHYMSVGTYMPEVPEKYQALKSANVCDCSSYLSLHAIDEAGFDKIFVSILSSKNSITPFDKEVVGWFFENRNPDISSIDIPFKENLCMVLANHNELVEAKSVTINDILRMVVYTQDGDLTLPAIPKSGSEKEAFKFKKMSREQRKYVLALIDSKVASKGYKACVMDGKKYIGRWIRLGEILHPGQYQNRYPNAFKFFNSLRNNANEFKTWHSALIELYRKTVGRKQENCRMIEIIDKLAERPGELIRKVDSVYRRSDKTSREYLINVLMNLEGAASKTLMELYTHISKRIDRLPRMITTPGSRKSVPLKTLDPLAETQVKAIKGAILNALMKNFAAKESWEGKTIVLDDGLEAFEFPYNMRAASEGKLTISKGFRIPFDKVGPNGEDTIRFYTHWEDPHGRYDLDLHAYFVDANYTRQENVGWNTANKNAAYATYSGDVRHRVGSCAEYIDVRIADALRAGWRYVLINLNSFNGQPFNTIESTFGFTYRKKPETGLTWSPKQVVQQIRLTSSARNIACALVDLEEGWVKVIDTDWNGVPVANAHMSQNLAYTKFYSINPELNVSLILQLNAKARNAKRIMTKEEYEAWFDHEVYKLHEENNERAKNGEEPISTEVDTSNVIFFSFQEFLDDYTKLYDLI